MNKYNTATTLFILLLATFVFCSAEDNLRGGEQSQSLDNEDVFIVKQYENLNPKGGGCRDPILSSEPYLKNCLFHYFGTPNSPQIVPSINVYIKQYPDATIAYKWLIHDEIRGSNFSKEKKGYSEYDGKRNIIKNDKKDNSIVSSEWLSDNMRIKIATNNTSIPEALLNDYLIKYPPTITFKSEDFNEDMMIREGLEARYKKIALLEKDRDSSRSKYKKQEEYHSMIFQCKHELYIRCQLGLTDENNKVDCVNTFILDDSKRSAEWKNLEDMIKNHDIVFSNVYWAKMDKIKCDKDKDYEYKKKMIKALGLTKDDLKDWPVSSQLVEEENK